MGGRLHFKAELLSQNSKLKIQKIVIGDMFLRNRKGCLWKMNE